MVRITEKEFARICGGIFEEKAIICKHNPIGTPEEILLWMLLNCLIVYLSLSEIETPCFKGMPSKQIYREAIHFVLKDRMDKDFNIENYLRELVKK